MKKFVNNVDEILTESLTGFGAAHSEILEIKLWRFWKKKDIIIKELVGKILFTYF